jgi:hypothetical protein
MDVIPTMGDITMDWNSDTSGVILYSDMSIAGYPSWYDCTNDDLINNGGTQITTTDNGAYYYEYTTVLGCTYSSDCFYLEGLSVGSENELNNVNVYPNPTNGDVNINIDGLDANVTVYDLTGKVIYTEQTNSSTMFTLNGESGVYIVVVESEGSTKQFKLIKK